MADLPPRSRSRSCARRCWQDCAFELSFDEIIVTTFTAGGARTLPIRILTDSSRPNQPPVVNVVAFFVVLLSVVPVYLAHRLTSDRGEGGPGPAGEALAVP